MISNERIAVAVVLGTLLFSLESIMTIKGNMNMNEHGEIIDVNGESVVDGTMITGTVNLVYFCLESFWDPSINT